MTECRDKCWCKQLSGTSAEQLKNTANILLTKLDVLDIRTKNQEARADCMQEKIDFLENVCSELNDSLVRVEKVIDAFAVINKQKFGVELKIL